MLTRSKYSSVSSLSSAIADSDRRSRHLPQTTLSLRQGLYSVRLLAQTCCRCFSNIISRNIAE